MRRRTMLVAGVLAVAVGIQAVGPERTNPVADPAMTLEASAEIPPDVAATLRRACYDCHSNETRWPWYARVAPVSWLVVNDVKNGRGQMNLSTWATYNAYDRADMLEDVCKMTRTGKMPLAPYLQMHSEARLTEHDIVTLCAWTSREAQRLVDTAAPE